MSAERSHFRFPLRRAPNLRIVRTSDDKPEEYPYLYRGEDATVFTTKDGANWRLHVNPEAKVGARIIRPDKVVEGTQAQAVLHTRLSELSKSSTPNADTDRQSTAIFLRENWDTLHPFLYKETEASKLATGSFTWVDLGEAVDFIGTGPDGHIFIFDAGPGRKVARLDMVTDTLKQLFPAYAERIVPLRMSLTNESRSPVSKQMRLNISPKPRIVRNS